MVWGNQSGKISYWSGSRADGWWRTRSRFVKFKMSWYQAQTWVNTDSEANDRIRDQQITSSGWSNTPRLTWQLTHYHSPLFSPGLKEEEHIVRGSVEERRVVCWNGSFSPPPSSILPFLLFLLLPFGIQGQNNFMLITINMNRLFLCTPQ